MSEMHYSIWSDAEKRDKAKGGGLRTAVASALLLVKNFVSFVGLCVRIEGR